MSDERASKIGTIGWLDLTVPEAEGLRDFYSEVVGWEAEEVDMGGYADFSMKSADGLARAGVFAYFMSQPILLGFILYLLWDDTFHVRRELTRGFPARHFIWIGAKFVLLGGVITLATAELFPDRFLAMPLYVPALWLMIMALYPLLSVIPQELVFRTFFFHRYGPLFGDWKWMGVAVNGLLFGFAHIIFDNWLAVAGSAVIGAIIAYRYWVTRSFWAAWLEHTLYGCLIFTIGLGRFFFTGVSNF